MGKNSNRQRRKALAARSKPDGAHEDGAPVLRLVRSDGADVSVEPIAAGCTGEAVAAVPEQERSDGACATEAGGHHVVAAADARPGDDREANSADAGPVRIERSFDAAEINRIINDPSVFPLVAIPQVDVIDVTSFVQDPRNVLIMAKGGGALFILDEPGVYEVHTSFLPGFRGAHAIAASLLAYRWMFTHTDCMSILTKVPAFNRPAAYAARKAGFEPRFERKAIWPTTNGPVDLKYYEFSYQRWIDRDAPFLIEAGKTFHDRLDLERERHGFVGAQHADEECHDLYVGACAATVYGGQPEKAVILYNRWARFAGYGEIAMLAKNPLMIDIGTALLQIVDGSFKAIKVSA